MAAEGSVRQPLSHVERLDWLRLARSENVGPVTFRKLLRHFGSARTAIDALPEMSRRGGSARTLKICPVADAEREFARAEELGCRLICVDEPEYPSALRATDSAPPLLAVKGNSGVLDRRAVAIVGSRNASALGCKFARNLAAGLGEAGYAVVSGLARGIDAAAHEASVESGTIAVLAGGLDRPYPPDNIPLLESICASSNSAAVSEMPFGWEPRARDFPRRNRIIAGIGIGLVVVEAAKRSGSLISARNAADIGRLVFAVPGSPLDPRAKGTNDLIRDGAILVGGADDVLEALTPLAGRTTDQHELPLLLEEDVHDPVASEPSQSGREQVISALGPSPTAIDELVRHTERPPAEVYMLLLELDLAGRLARHPGGSVSLLPERSH